MYPALKRHFERQGYRVYAELPAPHGGYMDLVAVKNGAATSHSAARTVAVEMKLRFSRLALTQAVRNRAFVWQSVIAVKEPFALDRRLRTLMVRRRVGLVAVGEGGVRSVIAAKEEAPAYSVKEVFGRHLEGRMAALYAGALGGVPTAERVSAFREFALRVRSAILARGGTAPTEQILEDTLGWNYFRARRAGLLFVLGRQFRQVAEDLWATADRARPAIHVVRSESVVKARDSLHVVLDESTELAAHPGDIVWFVDRGAIRARALLKFASRYPVKQTPQRDFRAGPAIFFPWRLTGAPPREVIVIGLTAYRELRRPRPLDSAAQSPWSTLRIRRT